jgi:hypothetical protein
VRVFTFILSHASFLVAVCKVYGVWCRVPRDGQAECGRSCVLRELSRRVTVCGVLHSFDVYLADDAVVKEYYRFEPYLCQAVEVRARCTLGNLREIASRRHQRLME